MSKNIHCAPRHRRVHRPNQELGRLMDAFWNRSLGDIVGVDHTISTPAVNIQELEDRWVLDLAIPGMTRDQIDVTVDEQQLVIKGEQSESTEESQSNYRRQEFRYGKFARRFTLPENANLETIEAKQEHGVLSITVLKAEPEVKVAKKIEIS